MGFWIFMLIMNLMIPLIMIGFGKIFLKWAPKEINPLFGYRTNMSMKNQDTWQFAHHCFGKWWYWSGIFLIPVSVIPMLFVTDAGEAAVGIVGGVTCTFECIGLIIPVFFVEKALKQVFDSDGKRKCVQEERQQWPDSKKK